MSKIRCGSITSVYNAGKYFKDCYDGLMGQTHKLNGIVVIDDGSTDDSFELVLKTIDPKLDPRRSLHEFSKDGIQYFIIKLNKNYGPSYARNIGLKYLSDKTDVITIADCDDIYYPTKVEKSIAIMEQYPQVLLVYTDYFTQDMTKGTKKREFKEIYSYKRLAQECITSSNFTFATKAALQVGGWDNTIRFGEDFDLVLRLADLGALHHIPEALYAYRLTGQNVTLTTPPEKFAQHVNRVYEKMLQRKGRKSHGI